MDLSEAILLGLIVLFVLGAVVRIFRSPFKLMMEVLGNSLLGFMALFLVNATSTMTGITLGVNVLNALVIGILGVPGLGLLMLLSWLF